MRAQIGPVRPGAAGPAGRWDWSQWRPVNRGIGRTLLRRIRCVGYCATGRRCCRCRVGGTTGNERGYRFGAVGDCRPAGPVVRLRQGPQDGSRCGKPSWREARPGNWQRHQAGDRRVADQGADDRRLPRRRLRCRGLERAHPRPAAQRRRRPGRPQGRVLGPPGRQHRQRLRAALRRQPRPQAAGQPAQGACSRTPTSSTSPQTRTARAKRSPGTWSRR